jgi:hypothetical protein
MPVKRPFKSAISVAEKRGDDWLEGDAWNDQLVGGEGRMRSSRATGLMCWWGIMPTIRNWGSMTRWLEAVFN